MQLPEVIAMLRWINESDPRFPFNDSTVEKWHYALREVDAAVAKQAVLEYVKKHEQVPMPSHIATRARHIAASREAGERAMVIEPAPMPVKHPLSWRKRNPELWDQLFEEGRRQGNEERRKATEARQAADVEPDHTDWMAA